MQSDSRAILGVATRHNTMKVLLPNGQTLLTDDKTAEYMISCGLAKAIEEKPKAEPKKAQKKKATKKD